MLKLPIYLDSHATTPVDPRVVAAMLPFLTERFGNAASRNHAFGWDAGQAVERARRQVADLLGARPKEIVFTSGATESNNLAIRGVVDANRDRGDHVVTVSTEHHAVVDTCQRLEREGLRVTYLPVGADGLLNLDDLRRVIDDRTLLVSVMTANNEIGVIQPLADIGRLARERGILFHTDAAQAAGKVPLTIAEIDADLVSITAHKMYGPKGVGALFVRSRRPRLRLAALFDGGGHERGMRPGTLNVPGIVGFGAAAEICRLDMAEEAQRMRRLRDRLKDGLEARLTGVIVNGTMVHRLPHNLNVSFAGVSGETLHQSLTEVAVSSGAACTSASVAPSHVLRSLGVPDDLAHATIRFGLGRFTTDAEIDHVINHVADVVTRLRSRMPETVSGVTR